jgi:hypothetical protein
VELLGLRAGQHREADHRVLVDTDAATGLAYAATFLEVVQDAQGLVLAERGVKEWRAFAFAVAYLAGAASQQTALLVGSVAEADAEIVQAARAVPGAVGFLAAALREVIQRSTALGATAGVVLDYLLPPA